MFNKIKNGAKYNHSPINHRPGVLTAPPEIISQPWRLSGDEIFPLILLPWGFEFVVFYSGSFYLTFIHIILSCVSPVGYQDCYDIWPHFQINGRSHPYQSLEIPLISQTWLPFNSAQCNFSITHSTGSWCIITNCMFQNQWYHIS